MIFKVLSAKASNKDESQVSIVGWNSDSILIRFHLHEAQEQAKLIYEIKIKLWNQEVAASEWPYWPGIPGWKKSCLLTQGYAYAKVRQVLGQVTSLLALFVPPKVPVWNPKPQGRQFEEVGHLGGGPVLREAPLWMGL